MTYNKASGLTGNFSFYPDRPSDHTFVEDGVESRLEPPFRSRIGGLFKSLKLPALRHRPNKL